MKNEAVYRSKQLNKYYEGVKRVLECNKKNKNELLNQLKNSVEDYIESNPNCTFSEIEAHFGNPQSIAKQYSTPYVTEHTNRTKNNKIIKISAVIMIALILLCVVITVLSINHTNDIPKIEWGADYNRSE